MVETGVDNGPAIDLYKSLTSKKLSNGKHIMGIRKYGLNGK